MILARNAIQQTDVDVAEDGVTLVATGHTADPDDTAAMSEPIDPSKPFEQQASELRFRLEFANALSRGLHAAFADLVLPKEAR